MPSETSLLYGIHLDDVESQRIYAANATRLIIERRAPAPRRYGGEG